jgi:hypothetical protein
MHAWCLVAVHEEGRQVPELLCSKEPVVSATQLS